MAIPTSTLSVCKVTGTFLTLDGTPIRNLKVVFEADQKNKVIQSPAAKITFPTVETFGVTNDAGVLESYRTESNGSLTKITGVELVFPNDPDLAQTGWNYTVTFMDDEDNTSTRLSFKAIAGTVDLSSATEVTSPIYAPNLQDYLQAVADARAARDETQALFDKTKYLSVNGVPGPPGPAGPQGPAGTASTSIVNTSALSQATTWPSSRIADVSRQIENTIPNGALEWKRADDWSSDLTYDTVDKPNSEVASVACKAGQGQTSAKASLFSVDPNIWYMFSVWLRADIEGSRILIQADSNPTNTPIFAAAKGNSSIYYLLAGVIVPTTWTKYVGYVKFNTGVNQVRISTIFFNQSLGTQGAIQKISGMRLVPLTGSGDWAQCLVHNATNMPIEGFDAASTLKYRPISVRRDESSVFISGNVSMKANLGAGNALVRLPSTIYYPSEGFADIITGVIYETGETVLLYIMSSGYLSPIKTITVPSGSTYHLLISGSWTAD